MKFYVIIREIQNGFIVDDSATGVSFVPSFEAAIARVVALWKEWKT